MSKRKKGNTLDRWEVSMVKAMLLTEKHNDQEILAYFTRPTRTINHRLIGQIRRSERFKGIKAATSEQLSDFLTTWPNIDPETGLDNRGDELLIKAREAMIAAVTIYNSAGLKFRSELFIVTAIIAWTYAFHAWFKRQGIDHRYKDKKTGKILKTKEGAERYWDLSQCLAHSKLPVSQGISDNLMFLTDIRHEIEHRSTSRIDDAISAKLQACCINFNSWLKTEFGHHFTLESYLPLALQMSGFDRDQKAILKAANDLPKNISAMVEKFESSLSDEQLKSSEFAYRAFFVQRTANRPGKADIAIEVVPAGSDEAIAAEKVFLKETDKKRYPPGKIVKIMQEEGYPNFKQHHHTQLWTSLKAKDPKKGFGRIGDYSNSWVWYENWLERVRAHCQENAAAYQ